MKRNSNCLKDNPHCLEDEIETKTARAKKIQRILDRFYPKPAIPLDHFDSYTLTIAVLLSTRCTDACVNKITPKLFAKAKTPEEMLQLSVQEIQDIIRPCGLSLRKANAIFGLSKKLLQDHGGKVPEDWKALEDLPGIGHKSASVVMAHAFGHPTFPVDTHIHRCARRWKLTEGKNIAQTERDLKAIFPQKDWNKLHLQMIYFGRQYCKAWKHNAEECPICSWV